MFSIGDRVVYENQGVYVVKNTTNSPVDKADDRLFYVLVPVYEPECNVVVTPVNNPKVRELITIEDAEEFIRNIPSIDLLKVENERARRDAYKSAFASYELEKYVGIIKTVHARRDDLLKNKKRLSETDADYEKRAKHALYSELATVYGVSIGDVEQLISDKIKNAG